jgi:hypothetical protein
MQDSCLAHGATHSTCRQKGIDGAKLRFLQVSTWFQKMTHCILGVNRQRILFRMIVLLLLWQIHHQVSSFYRTTFSITTSCRQFSFWITFKIRSAAHHDQGGNSISRRGLHKVSKGRCPNHWPRGPLATNAFGMQTQQGILDRCTSGSIL